MDTLKRIEQLRDERNWSNYRLAKEANLSQTTLQPVSNHAAESVFTKHSAQYSYAGSNL